MLTLTMTYHQKTGRLTQAKHQKAVFCRGVLFIEELDGELVLKDELRLFKKTPCFFLLAAALMGSHSNLIIHTLY